MLTLVVENELVVLNSKLGTRIDSRTGNFSSIDLTIVSTGLAYQLSWDVDNDNRGSDHFPIFVSLVGREQQKQTKRRQWKFKQADWVGFKNFIDERTDRISTVKEFTRIVGTAAEKNIPRSSATVGKKSTPWWEPEVKEAVRNRRKKLRTLRK